MGGKSHYHHHHHHHHFLLVSLLINIYILMFSWTSHWVQRQTLSIKNWIRSRKGLMLPSRFCLKGANFCFISLFILISQRASPQLLHFGEHWFYMYFCWCMLLFCENFEVNFLWTRLLHNPMKLKIIFDLPSCVKRVKKVGWTIFELHKLIAFKIP